MLLIEIIFVFGCIFSISMAEIDSELVVVRKCYCWGMISVKKRIPFNCLLSMRPKDYGLNASGGLDIGPDNIFVSFFVDLFKPKVTWVVYQLDYLNNDIPKTIEVKLSSENIFQLLQIIQQREVQQNNQDTPPNEPGEDV